MDKLILIQYLPHIAVVGLGYYIYTLKENMNKLKKYNQNLKSTINSSLTSQKEKLLKEMNTHIQNEKKVFVDNIKTSIDNFANNKTFEFVIDEQLHKSEFLNLKNIIDEKKDKYAYYFSMLMNKESKDNKELKQLVNDFKKLNEEYKSSLEKVNLKIKSINEVIDINSNNSKEGRKLAKDFETRISNLEELTFNAVVDDSGSDDYSFVGELDEDSSSGYGGAEVQDIKSNLQLPPKPKKDTSIANRYRNM
jgi:exonuclease VII large subunit